MKIFIAVIAALFICQVHSGVVDYMQSPIAYISSIGQLALDIDAVHSKHSDDNIVLSPLNLGSTLLTLLAASDGETHQELKKLLKFDKLQTDYHDEVVHRILGKLLPDPSMNPGSDVAEISQATGVFVQDGLSISADFKSIVENSYRCNVQSLDFLARAEEAREVINKWANDATRGKISSMLNDVPESTTEVIIASALYFKGAWKHPFFKALTKRRQFHTGKDEVMKVDMMYNVFELPFYADEKLGVKIVGLPYKGNMQIDVSMYVLLPDAKTANALAEVKNKLDFNVLNDLIRKMSVQECIIALPKMKLSSSVNLKKVLKNLGTSSLFNSGKVNLSALLPGKASQSISMMQKIEMTIDEIGTEAAATTSELIDKSGNTAKLVADRPFIFFIQDNNTKLIWFWATINRPVPNY